MSAVYLLLAGLVLDLILGDPAPLPHPIAGLGTLIEKLEQFLTKNKRGTFSQGVLLVFLVLLVATFIILALRFLFLWFYRPLADLFTIYLIWQGMAAKTLAAEGRKIAKLLESGRLKEARKEVGYLVTRDTSQMEAEDLSRATVETIAENIVDGITAPLFYAFIGGSYAGLTIMLYKAVNTLDSMVGYKNEKYLKFGRFAARLDDLLNWLPARITGLLIVFLSPLVGGDWKESWQVMTRDARKASGPNSGFSEAAAAGALKVKLGGPDYYFGQLVEKPFIGSGERKISPPIIREAVKLIYLSEALFFLIMSFFYLFWV